ncbi:mannosyl-oligosaccharide glucosidase GCS1 [Phalaenopsis equestris]|uniref:mannosyl-oligosaccharide glucosidase GCS1 n=1 Tax=Phalaenopsis equestris TaxID=78828 RepID=UPI0009E57556|nr:mannosyl-oligosaccharide glucosidase GCS1 [Phalaenopsis equestris]
MSGGSRATARSRGKPRAGDGAGGDSSAGNLRAAVGRGRAKSRDHGLLRIMNVRVRTLLGIGFGFFVILMASFLFYNLYGRSDDDPEVRKLMRIVTPLPAPKMLDLAQFQGEHKESLYWGTYRPHVYLGIRARNPKSLIFGLMWIGIKDGQYLLRHVCQDSDGLSTYGWIEHNGRDYGRQVLVDQAFTLTTSFLKESGDGSSYGGDWAVRLEAQNVKSISDEAKSSSAHLFFYIADEDGNSLSLGRERLEYQDDILLSSGSRGDVGGWEFHLKSMEKMEIHYAGFKTLHLHNLTELVQGTLAFNARSTGLLALPDALEDSPNIIVFQFSVKLPSVLDLAFVSGTDSKGSMVNDRINALTGTMLTHKLDERKKYFEDKYNRCFNTMDKVDSETIFVGKAAIANLLGGIGYFYGQSKIALPKGFSQKDGEKFISYWPAALYTAVPSRSYFPRGFLWDEGFHQLLIWRWDIDICLDIIGHWLDLINVDGWIPREQILGAEALSKVPHEFVPQHPSNGNPPTLFLVLHDLLSNSKSSKFSDEDMDRISSFFGRAYIRLAAWFQWFNNTQSAKNATAFYWHGRDNATTMELNPKTLSSGLDDYPRASHPSEDERHLDLWCWMHLASDCLHSIAEIIGMQNSSAKDYNLTAKKLVKFEVLNQLHLDEASGAYFDYGNHTEKVRLRWHEVNVGNSAKRELFRETLEKSYLQLVPHIGYISLFPFIMNIIPPESWILGRQLDLISNRSILWTDYGIRSLSKTSSLYMKRNTEHDPPYWRGPIWINLNYMILAALNHYSKVDGPYRSRAHELYKDLRSNLIRNIVKNYYETGYLWEQYDQAGKGKGRGTRPFTGWTSLVVLAMAEQFPSFQLNYK